MRNGDRWHVLARHGDDGFLVEDLTGRGQVVLPGDYVREEVALAYAVTIHKAQGLTVDSAIVLVDERTTAEGLYVGMTRGRAQNVALEAAQDGYDAVAAEQGQRQAWLEAHADTLAYRDQLAEAVTKRRRDLGVAAAITEPSHVVDLIGEFPGDDRQAMRMWQNLAGRIEAYREEWGVAPDQLREPPLDVCQARAWDVAVHASEMLARPPAPALDRGLDHGIELGWVSGGWATTSSPRASLPSMVPPKMSGAVNRCAAPNCVRP